MQSIRRGKFTRYARNVTSLSRNYSDETLKILWGLCKNQCAQPECNIPLIEPATKYSRDRVIGNICHIYSVSSTGPRGTGGLTEKELKSHNNLILLCPTHHVLVDGQPETYTVEVLRDWKQRHEARMRKRVTPIQEDVKPQLESHPSFPTALVDQKIEEEVWSLRKARFFIEFDTARASLLLGRKIAEGELSGGTDAVRCRGLAWCSRLLSRSNELGNAEKYWELAKQLGNCPEVDVAEAFVLCQKGDRSEGLKILANIDSAISRAAALSIVSHHENTEEAAAWITSVGFEPADQSADGKCVLLTTQLELGRWTAAKEIVDSLADQDFEEVPVLHHFTALSYLLAAVPIDLRGSVYKQVPFDVVRFPLASDELGLEVRRKAEHHFLNAVSAAHDLGCCEAATVFDQYALWLQLTDPDQSANGRERLEQQLRDVTLALPVVHLGLQFGVKLDLAAVEKAIEQQIALHGGITRSAALVRFALAFTKKSPEEVANDIAIHFEELGKFLDKKSMQIIQVEMLSLAGLTDKAMNILKSLSEYGLTQTEDAHLRRVIAEVKSDDSVALLKAKFKQTDSLNDLVSLVVEFETRQDWDGLCEFALLLFERTRSIRDAERLATALFNTHRAEQLIKLLQLYSDFLAQSNHLQALYAWVLYQEGKFIESRTALARLSDELDDPNNRTLRVSLAISLGDWNSLYSFIANEYECRDERSAQELISAAQLAVRLESPYAKNIILSAVEKGKDDADVSGERLFSSL